MVVLSKIWVLVFVLMMVSIENKQPVAIYVFLIAGAVLTLGKFIIDARKPGKMNAALVQKILVWVKKAGHFFSQAMYRGATGAMEVAATCACAGIIIGVMKLTGLGLKFTQAILAMSGGSLPIALVLVMCISLILGMGVPTVAAYIICSAVAAPALVRMGVDQFVAHMFVFYFAVFSCITPPVCIAAFAAAAIARANVWKVGITAVKIGAPVMITLLLTDVALGIVARTVPQMNIFIVGFPLKIGVGLLMLGAALPLVMQVFGRSLTEIQESTQRIIAVLAHT